MSPPRTRPNWRTWKIELKKVVYGQDDAIDALVTAIKRSRAGLGQPEKPVGSFLFTGPTGVGKTEVARQVARTWMSNSCAST
jgi:ATP-dependent Clp protease ATP-binding subunit ClpA